MHGTRNERVESVTTCRGSVSECGMGIGVGFFTSTTSFLRNPRVPRNRSYAQSWFLKILELRTFIYLMLTSPPGKVPNEKAGS